MMHPHTDSTGRELFAVMFSDDPLPDVEAAIVVAHPGDEAVSAAWLMARLQERTSVYCLTRAGHGCPGGRRARGTPDDAASARAATVAAAALAGVPSERCHNLGLVETELARDLETLVWLTTATVSSLKPRVLVTHACEGRNLDHDATCFAVHLAARLMTCTGLLAPLIVEVPRHHVLGGDAPDALPAGNARQAVKVEFGPESRKVKRRMLQCHSDRIAALEGGSLQSESYVLAGPGDPVEGIAHADGLYLDAPWCGVGQFREQARQVLAWFNRAVLSSPAQA